MTDTEMDAMRYRWLRDTNNLNFRGAEEFAETGTIDMIAKAVGPFGYAFLEPCEMDDAIDAAMKRWPL